MEGEKSKTIPQSGTHRKGTIITFVRISRIVNKHIGNSLIVMACFDPRWVIEEPFRHFL